MTEVGFVCVGNVGRNQMATAFAEQEREKRGLDDTLEIATGGIDPRDHVQEDVGRARRDSTTCRRLLRPNRPVERVPLIEPLA